MKNLFDKSRCVLCGLPSTAVAYMLLVMALVSGCMQKVNVTYAPRQKEIVAQEAHVVPEGVNSVESKVGSKEDTVCEATTVTDEIQQLQNYFAHWRGVRYRYGGVTTKGVDCSGLMLRAYKDLYNVNLPRTVAEQARQGTRIKKKYIQPGDLIFFKTGLRSRHVGFYLGGDTFIHASRSKGVIQSSLNNSYWRKKYWQAKRLYPLNS